jgi:hypothetical protein
MPHHGAIKEKFIQDLKKSIKTVQGNSTLASKGSAAMYGMVAKIPLSSIVEDFMIALLGKVYSRQ